MTTVAKKYSASTGTPATRPLNICRPSPEGYMRWPPVISAAPPISSESPAMLTRIGLARIEPTRKPCTAVMTTPNRMAIKNAANTPNDRLARKISAEAEGHDVAGQRDEGHADGDAADERDGVEQCVDAQGRGEAWRAQREGRDRRAGHDADS